MTNFVQLTDLPILDLYKEFNTLLDNKKISWFNNIEDQICLNSTADNSNNIHLGRGSLFQDWDNFYTDEAGNLIVPRRKKILTDRDFTVLCDQFKNTLFEDVYQALEKKYVLGRVRIMRSVSKSCLTWHVDHTNRVHYPMKTQEGCFMIIEDEIQHLSENTWWWTNTTIPHTAINASRADRYHLVAVILKEK